jgi:hypothetical protein
LDEEDGSKHEFDVLRLVVKLFDVAEDGETTGEESTDDDCDEDADEHDLNDHSLKLSLLNSLYRS